MEALLSYFDAPLGLSVSEAGQLSALQVCLRAVIVFIAMIAFVRIGKKRFLGQATALDFILVIMIGAIASRAISGTAPFVPSLAGALVLILMHRALSYMTETSKPLSDALKGHDTVLIRDGRIDRKALRDAHMSDDDLAEDLRLQGIADPAEVAEARLERSGKLSVIKR